MAYIGKTPTTAPLTSSDIAADIINNTHIGDTAISGFDALATAPADTDEFLISDGGVLKRLDASLIGGGSLVKLASTTISSGVAAVSFNSTYINSTHDNYKVIAYGVTAASDNQDIALRMSVDNGSNFATHVGVYNWTHVDNTGGSNTAQTYNGSQDALNLGTDEEGDASGGVNFMIDLMDLNSTTSYKTANGIGVAENQNGDYYGYRTHAYIQSTSAVNFFKIFTLQGGNLDSGTVTLYGYEK